MKTASLMTPDGLAIACDCCGDGPGLLLLHGGGGRRQEWASAGYVKRLQNNFTVITMDLRGHGESSKPSEPSCYAVEKQTQDILQVASEFGLKNFSIWGMSYGGKVGRYATVYSDRVDKVALFGTPLGPGVSGQRRKEAIDFAAHWPPILQAWQSGELDLAALPQNEQNLLLHADLPAMLGWVQSMLDWPAVTPADFRCPALWLIGSEDRAALESLEEFAPQIPGSNLRVQILSGLGHEQVFDAIDRVFPLLLEFTQSTD